MGIRDMRRTARVALVAVVALLVPVGALTAVAHATAPGQTWVVQVGSQTPNRALQGMRFLPGEITIDAGDTVSWVARSAEIHTVTFFPGGGPQATLPEFDPTNAAQLTQQGGSTYSTATGFNSGLITTVHTGDDVGPFPPTVPLVQKYSLTFPDPGTFTYYCLVHGKMMVGVVHVQAAGAPYPLTQAQYDEQARLERIGMRVTGNHLRRDLRAQSTRHKVFLGDDNGVVMVMRFVRPTVVIHRGQSVRFKNIGMGAPHTVTFGTEPAPPALFAPSGNPARYRGGDLNSGILPPHSTFKVTFKKAGTFHYVCALHDFMGMVGKVVVRP